MSLEALAKFTAEVRTNAEFRAQVLHGAVTAEDAETTDALVAYAKRLEQGQPVPSNLRRDAEAVAWWYAG